MWAAGALISRKHVSRMTIRCPAAKKTQVSQVLQRGAFDLNQ